MVTSLLAWARGQEAAHAYLQVVATNAAGIALYRQLDFEVLYRYWYRVSPP
ncbi:MAG: hypothetical protein HC809_07680 [Gammaproteobacteria bacterium]|nr:hypothetical protein [Gammaproteobacteria bacterium]